jgi:molybdopterin-guanine dinucleotide biosynthesis protein A
MGRPKAWLPFAGEFMLPRVVRLLSTAVRPVIVVAALGQDVPSVPADVVIVRDQETGCGPLEGLRAGLAALAGDAEAAYVSSCDVPFLKPTFVRRLIDLAGDHAICVPRIGGLHHPLAAVYRLDILDGLRQLLAERCLRATLLFEKVPTRTVEAAELVDVDPTFQSLRNLNTPQDYEGALTEALAAEPN